MKGSPRFGVTPKLWWRCCPERLETGPCLVERGAHFAQCTDGTTRPYPAFGSATNRCDSGWSSAVDPCRQRPNMVGPTVLFRSTGRLIDASFPSSETPRPRDTLRARRLLWLRLVRVPGTFPGPGPVELAFHGAKGKNPRGPVSSSGEFCERRRKHQRKMAQESLPPLSAN